MAHPNVVKARQDRKQADKDLREAMREMAAVISGLRTNKVFLSTDLAVLEQASDDLKSAVVHLTNANAAVDFWEES